MVPAARPSWAAASAESGSTGTFHVWARGHLVVSRAPNSHDSVGTGVKVLSRHVERLVTAVAEFGIYGKCMNREARGGDDEKNILAVFGKYLPQRQFEQLLVSLSVR